MISKFSSPQTEWVEYGYDFLLELLICPTYQGIRSNIWKYQTRDPDSFGLEFHPLFCVCGDSQQFPAASGRSRKSGVADSLSADDHSASFAVSVYGFVWISHSTSLKSVLLWNSILHGPPPVTIVYGLPRMTSSIAEICGRGFLCDTANVRTMY